jgi:hypothetical protein
MLFLLRYLPDSVTAHVRSGGWRSQADLQAKVEQ